MPASALPILLYGACVVGALGVATALPKRGINPQLIGVLVAALGLGGVFVYLGLKAGGEHLPNFNFYIFSSIALGAALRVISHPRPVYAALYFILTILASCGLYVLLSAEFMAFALVIVYAGAILITYLFVIMLATESPTAEQVESLSEYDRYSREPAVATLVGFVLIAALTVTLGRGSGELPAVTQFQGSARLDLLPKKIETALREAGLITKDESVAVLDGRAMLDEQRRRVAVEYGERQIRLISMDDPKWPADLKITNTEGVGFSLLADHPGAIEIAGVILLMAMLGAVVLARKKVELDEFAKLAAQKHAHLTSQPGPGGVGGGLGAGGGSGGGGL